MAEEETSPPAPPPEQPAAEQPLPPKKEEPTTPTDTPEVLKKADDRIAQATAMVVRQEAATAALKEQLDRQEAMNVETTLGGKTDAGTTGKKELTPAEYKDMVMKGQVPNAT